VLLVWRTGGCNGTVAYYSGRCGMRWSVRQRGVRQAIDCDGVVGQRAVWHAIRPAPWTQTHPHGHWRFVRGWLRSHSHLLLLPCATGGSLLDGPWRWASNRRDALLYRRNLAAQPTRQPCIFVPALLYLGHFGGLRPGSSHGMARICGRRRLAFYDGIYRYT